jgi:hypothetical protein
VVKIRAAQRQPAEDVKRADLGWHMNRASFKGCVPAALFSTFLLDAPPHVLNCG